MDLQANRGHVEHLEEHLRAVKAELEDQRQASKQDNEGLALKAEEIAVLSDQRNTALKKHGELDHQVQSLQYVFG